MSILLVLWLLLCWSGLVSRQLYDSSMLIVAVFLYVLAFPVSLVLRLDHLTEQFGYQSSFEAQLIALLYIGANFTLLGALHGSWRQWKSSWKKNAAGDRPHLGSGPTRLNGAGDRTEPH